MRRTLVMMAMDGKAYAWRLSQGWRNVSTPAAWGSHAGAKNTGSLADSDEANRSMIAGHWRRRSWTTSWCSVHSEPITRMGRLRRSALVMRDPCDLHGFYPQENLPRFEEQVLRPRASRSPEVSDCRDNVAKESDRPASEKRAEL